eukprot:jgi/Mesen1/9686/ME000680S09085
MSEHHIKKWLQSNLERPTSDLISKLSKGEGAATLGTIVSRPALSQPQVDVLVRVLARDEMRSSMLRESTNCVYGLLLGSPFLARLHAHVQGLRLSAAQPDCTLLPYVKLCEEIQSRSADGWREVPLDALKGRVEELPDECAPKQSLLADIGRLVDQRARLRVTSAVRGPPQPGLVGEAFRTQPIVPSVKEMRHVAAAADLPVNHTAVPYETMLQYLETHFQLLREDCMQPLRVGIRQYRCDTASSGCRKRSQDVRIYTHIRMVGIRCGRVGLEYLLKFKIDSGRKVDWGASKRLMSGALLCISADNFETVQFAVVAKRTDEDLGKGLVDVRMVEEDEDERKGLHNDKVYVMAESTAAYFEAYSHVLRSLQRPDMEQIPFQQQLIHLHAQVAPPSYLKNRGIRGEYDFLSVFPEIHKDLGTSRVHILEEAWPEWTSTLDPSQKAALKRALTKELALIQGPPGTGKTFVGLLAMKLLLANVSRASGSKLQGLLAKTAGEKRPDLATVGSADVLAEHGRATTGPILVVCYTNHALDQFLEGILAYEKSVVRIGGRCKSEVLKSHNLQELLFKQRDNRSRERAHHYALREARARSRGSEEDVMKNIQRLRHPAVTPETLQGVATEEQISSLFYGDEDVLEGSPLITRGHAAKCVEFWLIEHRYFRHMAEGNSRSLPIPLVLQPDAGWGNQDSRFNALVRPQEGSGNGGRARARVERDLGDNDDDDEAESLGDEEELRELEGDRQEEDFALGGRRQAQARMYLLQDPKVVQHGRGRGRQQQVAVPGADGPGNLAMGFEEEEEVDKEREEGEVALGKVVDQPNVWDLSEHERVTLHNYWLGEIRAAAGNKLPEIAKDYCKAQRQVAAVDNKIQLSLLRESRVVGMTTTAAARHHDLLTALKPEIIVVEEAAEVLESHILACLTPAAQHLILIGDHQQLRPSVAVYALAKKHGLDVSMFERLMANGVEGTTLSVQHRMRPAIARLVAPIIYPHLQNHTDVRAYPEVRGVARSLCFLDHRVPENHDGELGSKVNGHEARLCVELCAYFLKQGYRHDQVVILTMYTGQLLEIKRLLRTRLTMPYLPHVSSVDNYQGEECDIVILSLVRSNHLESHNGPGKIGFLAVANRVCVALSRARMGLFMLGNAQLLAAKSPQLWGRVLRELREQGCVAPSITLRCQNHEDALTEVSEPAHFHAVKEGGCGKPCDCQLNCGHLCPRRCHLGGHDDVTCPRDCKRELPGCEHQCSSRCHGLEEACPPCARRVQKMVPSCGHAQTMACSARPEIHLCLGSCAKVLACGHACDKMCYQPCSERCIVLVDKVMPCGHDTRVRCFQKQEELKCNVQVEKTLSCGHSTRVRCSQKLEAVECHVQVEKKLPCGHEAGMPCPQKLEDYVCQVAVDIPMPCGHTEEVPCFRREEALSCRALVDRVAPCGHGATMPCSEKLEDFVCRAPVDKKLPCGPGHSARMPCFLSASEFVCRTRVDKVLPCGHCARVRCFQTLEGFECHMKIDKEMPCGHHARMPCNQEPEEVECQVPCRERLTQCGHECVGTCSACKRGTQHVSCQRACRSILPCGDACVEKCASFCPPCWRRCQSRCRHARCRRKCGEPCLPCREPCAWRCVHFSCEHLCHEVCTRPRCNAPCTQRLRCGHPCIGLCGEACPTKCHTCNPHLSAAKGDTKVAIGADREMRCIQLEDCGHLFEVATLDRWMDAQNTCSPLDVASDAEHDATTRGGLRPPAVPVKLKECPECGTPIRRTTGRYSNIVKERLGRLEAVKRQIVGYDAVNKGNLLLTGSHPKFAEQKFRQALHCNPRLPGAHHGLGLALLAQQYCQSALKHFYAVARSSPLRDVIPGGLEAIVRGDGRAGLLPAGNLPVSGPADSALQIEALLLMAETIPRVRAQAYLDVIQICDTVLSIEPENAAAKEMKKQAQIHFFPLSASHRAQVVNRTMREVGKKGQ